MNHLCNMEKFKGSSNYKTWVIKIQRVLIKKRLQDAIKPDVNLTFPGTTKSITKSANNLTLAIYDKTLNQQAVATIILLLDNRLIDHAIGISLSTALWKTLKDFFSLQEFKARHLLHKKLVLVPNRWEETPSLGCNTTQV